MLMLDNVASLIPESPRIAIQNSECPVIRDSSENLGVRMALPIQDDG
jgi:hypothetical protein